MLDAMLSILQEGGMMDPVAAREYLGLLGAGLGVGLTVIGVGLGIGRIGDAAASGIARQPEAAGNIQTASIILAALIEGVGLFALVIALLYKILEV